MANDNLHELINPTLYIECAKFFFTAVINFVYGLLFLIPCFSWNSKQAMSSIIPACLRLFGIFIGVSISLFYLYVGLFTKDGIEFALKTIMRNVSVDSQAVIAFYDSFHAYVDILCAISSLFFNGILTQLPESIKKCDDIATKIEKWIESSEPFSSVSVTKEVTPVWIHFANFIDIGVFALSAMTSIAGLLMLLMASGNAFMVPLACFLQKMHYAEIAGVCAGLANLIFTYAASAPGQMLAWKLLFPKEGYQPLLADDSRKVSDQDVSAFSIGRSSFFSVNPADQERSCCTGKRWF